jgi:hypothetical protein
MGVMARAARAMVMATNRVIARKRMMVSNDDNETMVTETMTTTKTTTAMNTTTTMTMLTTKTKTTTRQQQQRWDSGGWRWLAAMGEEQSEDHQFPGGGQTAPKLPHAIANTTKSSTRVTRLS